jgi:inorganic pyrophosphatase
MGVSGAETACVVSCSYGAFPQTWEDPTKVDAETGIAGDGDPVDVIDLGFRQYPMGSVIRVRPLGVLGLIDEGEMDWKVVSLCVQDPLADEVLTLDDAFNVIPGALDAFREWMRLYKSPHVNQFAFEGEFRDAAFARTVLNQAHAQWKDLIAQKGPNATL